MENSFVVGPQKLDPIFDEIVVELSILVSPTVNILVVTARPQVSLLGHCNWANSMRAPESICLSDVVVLTICQFVLT